MADAKPKHELSPETLTAQALGRIDAETRAVVPPLHLSTTYERDPDGGYRSGRGYTRPHNPSYDTAEALLTHLEGGAESLLFSSGMAAATAVFQCLLPGDHVVVSRVMYWALRSWLSEFAVSWGLEVEFVDNADLAALAAAMRPGRTRLVWLETPANPTWSVTDIAAAAVIAHDAHARLAVDSTVATPVLTRPIEHGADLVMHSATKYLNGHSDVLAGALVGARVDSFWHRIRAWRRDAGAVLGPFEAWLLLRGMRTLFLRVNHCSRSAAAIAKHFEGHALVAEVLYPGLAGHPGHDIAARQMRGGFGGMLSLRHRHGEAAAVEAAARVGTFKRATSLGGVESLIEHRASIEGPSTTVPRDLLRLSVGLESVADLIADLEQALDTKHRSATLGNATTAAAPEPARSERGRIEALIADRIRPSVLDRGADLEVEGYADGRVKLRFAGSPGAVIPIRREMESLLRHYVPGVEGVDIAPAGAASAEPGGDAPIDKVREVLSRVINPAVASHGGAISVEGADERAVYLRLEGRCQGCAMAEVTLRQGVEPLLRERIAGLGAVVDVTEHDRGTNPYFKTRKGAKG